MPPKKIGGSQLRRGRSRPTEAESAPIPALLPTPDAASAAGNQSADDLAALVSVLTAVDEPESELPVASGAMPVQATVESAALDDVARSLAVAESCTTTLTESPWASTQSVRDIIAAATIRAAAVLQLLRFLKGDYAPVQTAAPASAILQRVSQLTEAERRLRGISLSTPVIEHDVTLTTDESLLSHVLVTLLLTTFTFVEGVDNPGVVFDFESGDKGRLAFSITYAHVPALLGSPTVSKDDSSLRSRHALRLIAFSATDLFARTRGGTFTAVVEESSTRILLELPATAAQAA